MDLIFCEIAQHDRLDGLGMPRRVRCEMGRDQLQIVDPNRRCRMLFEKLTEDKIGGGGGDECCSGFLERIAW